MERDLQAVELPDGAVIVDEHGEGAPLAPGVPDPRPAAEATERRSDRVGPGQ
jgi:hypothetical protein